jgi:hypothetical protein
MKKRGRPIEPVWDKIESKIALAPGVIQDAVAIHGKDPHADSPCWTWTGACINRNPRMRRDTRLGTMVFSNACPLPVLKVNNRLQRVLLLTDAEFIGPVPPKPRKTLRLCRTTPFCVNPWHWGVFSTDRAPNTPAVDPFSLPLDDQEFEELKCFLEHKFIRHPFTTVEELHSRPGLEHYSLDDLRRAVDDL